MSGTPLSRRGVVRVAGVGGVAGLLGAGLFSGCDLDPDASPKPPALPPRDPDQDIVDAARTELQALIVRLSGTTGTASLVACHRRQLAALEGDPPARTRQGRPLRRAQIVERERRSAERFTEWAATARNGDLARVLASVAAGIRMQPVLSEDRRRPPGGPS